MNILRTISLSPLWALLYSIAFFGCTGKWNPPVISGTISDSQQNVQVELWFEPTVDLDLFVVDPMAEEVYFGNSPSRLGGWLDADIGCGDPPPYVETIHFDPAPAGDYRISVDFPERCTLSVNRTSFQLVVHADGTHRVDGSVEFGQQVHTAFAFSVGAPEREHPL